MDLSILIENCRISLYVNADICHYHKNIFTNGTRETNFIFSNAYKLC